MLDDLAFLIWCLTGDVSISSTAFWETKVTLNISKSRDVIADGDAPGRVAAQKVADTIGWSARVVDLGDGIDANEFIASHGEAAFRERIMK